MEKNTNLNVNGKTFTTYGMSLELHDKAGVLLKGGNDTQFALKQIDTDFIKVRYNDALNKHDLQYCVWLAKGIACGSEYYMLTDLFTEQELGEVIVFDLDGEQHDEPTSTEDADTTQPLTIEQLYHACQKYMAMGQGKKKILISSDDEGNSFHGLYFAFSDPAEIFSGKYAPMCHELQYGNGNLNDYIVLG